MKTITVPSTVSRSLRTRRLGLKKAQTSLYMYTVLQTYNLCDVSACNTEAEIEAGTNFVLTLPEVLYVGFDEELKYSVSLRQKYMDEPIINMCVDFKLPTSSAST
ncbi:hypothetical protein ARALYDRAFT_901581 [Arabidopsis lyrata subsp. lyrata]|uniref:Uncharacterized protein n=1 Tax=Arabidopsis lyrata subsp. lyrata TaxID=81972 RepID=D7LG78_ARALL|nr:hypothetical protein ARALYDRAFT_901581 [Arabidopsis lyrata subsp. lyrata]